MGNFFALRNIFFALRNFTLLPVLSNLRILCFTYICQDLETEIYNTHGLNTCHWPISVSVSAVSVLLSAQHQLGTLLGHTACWRPRHQQVHEKPSSVSLDLGDRSLPPLPRSGLGMLRSPYCCWFCCFASLISWVHLTPAHVWVNSSFALWTLRFSCRNQLMFI